MKSFAVRDEPTHTLTATGALPSAGKRIGVTLSRAAPAAISLILMAGVMAFLLVASGMTGADAGISPVRDLPTEPPAITQPWAWRSDNLAQQREWYQMSGNISHTTISIGIGAG